MSPNDTPSSPNEIAVLPHLGKLPESNRMAETLVKTIKRVNGFICDCKDPVLAITDEGGSGTGASPSSLNLNSG